MSNRKIQQSLNNRSDEVEEKIPKAEDKSLEISKSGQKEGGRVGRKIGFEIYRILLNDQTHIFQLFPNITETGDGLGQPFCTVTAETSQIWIKIGISKYRKHTTPKKHDQKNIFTLTHE